MILWVDEALGMRLFDRIQQPLPPLQYPTLASSLLLGLLAFSALATIAILTRNKAS